MLATAQTKMARNALNIIYWDRKKHLVKRKDKGDRCDWRRQKTEVDLSSLAAFCTQSPPSRVVVTTFTYNVYIKTKFLIYSLAQITLHYVGVEKTKTKLVQGWWHTRECPTNSHFESLTVLSLWIRHLNVESSASWWTKSYRSLLHICITQCALKYDRTVHLAYAKLCYEMISLAAVVVTV